MSIDAKKPSSDLVAKDVESDLIFRNPRPHVKSLHAYFPSVAVLPDGQMVATYVLGEAFESVDMRVHVARSTDFGDTWRDEGPICKPTTDRLTSIFGRLAVTVNRETASVELVANLLRCDRTDHPDEGLGNPKTMGFVPTKMLLTRSTDAGHTWTQPQRLDPPLLGPELEMCSPITVLSDGRWLLPTSMWRDWEGNLPNGNRMVAFVSQDEGKTWPGYMDVMADKESRLIYWESKIIELSDGRLLAVAWCYDETTNKDLPNQYALSSDAGATWTAPASTALQGQTLTSIELNDGRVLSVYRRIDRPGLWANLSQLHGDRWINTAEQPLWGHDSTMALTKQSDNMIANFNVLRFGAPCLASLPDGRIFVAFWGYEDTTSVIRWFKLEIA